MDIDPCLCEISDAELLCADLLLHAPALHPSADVAALAGWLDGHLELSGLPVHVVGVSATTVELRHRCGPSGVVPYEAGARRRRRVVAAGLRAA